MDRTNEDQSIPPRRATRGTQRGAPVRSRGVASMRPPSAVGEQRAVEWVASVPAVVGILRQALPQETWVIVVDGWQSGLTERMMRAIREASSSARIWTIRDTSTDQESPPTGQEGGEFELDLSDVTDAAVRENLTPDLVVVPRESSITVDDRIRRWRGQTPRILMEDPALETVDRAMALQEGSACALLAVRTETPANGAGVNPKGRG